MGLLIDDYFGKLRLGRSTLSEVDGYWLQRQDTPQIVQGSDLQRQKEKMK